MRLIPPIICSSCTAEMPALSQCDQTVDLTRQLDNGAVLQLTKTIGAGYAHQHTYHYTIVEVSELFGCNFDGQLAPEIYLITESDGSDRLMYQVEVIEWIWLKLANGFDVEVSHG